MCVAQMGLKGKVEFTRTWEHEGRDCELKIEGSVVTNSVEVLAAVQEEQLLYRLWHYRMNHMNNRGLTELCRREKKFSPEERGK